MELESLKNDINNKDLKYEKIEGDSKNKVLQLEVSKESTINYTTI